MCWGLLSAMPPRPLDLPPEHRAILAEFERLYEHWRLASDAASAAECKVTKMWEDHAAGLGPAPDADTLQRALDLRASATRMHQQAAQLLRDAPI